MIPEPFVEVGVRLGLLVTGWLSLLFLVMTVVLAIKAVRDTNDYGWGPSAAISALGAAFLLVPWFIQMIPFSGEYHHLYRVEGHVEHVSNVITESSGDLTRTPVVTLDSLDRPVTIDDPRAVELAGEDVTLTCWIDWHYQAQDTYHCNIYSIGER